MENLAEAVIDVGLAVAFLGPIIVFIFGRYLQSAAVVAAAPAVALALFKIAASTTAWDSARAADSEWTNGLTLIIAVPLVCIVGGIGFGLGVALRALFAVTPR